MTASRDEKVRQRAYEIWQAEGCPTGQHEAHWLRAEQDVLAEETAEAPKAPARKAPARKPAAAKPAATKPAAPRKAPVRRKPAATSDSSDS